MIPGVKDALIFVMLEDGTVHQVDLPKLRTLELLVSQGLQLKLCEQAEPLTWERSEDLSKIPKLPTPATFQKSSD